MIIAIPSKGRPTLIKSNKVIPSALVYVPENEVPSYSACGVQNVIGVPLTVKGITQTRNWILDHCDSPRVVFIDDDVKHAGWIEMKATTTKQTPISEEDWIAEFSKLFDLTEQMGLRIWGISTQSAPRTVYPFKPFLFRSYVTASCMGILNHTNIRFDETFPVKEDYEMCLRCIKEDGSILACRYLYWQNQHWSTQGGCRDYRTQSVELDAINRLKKMYPGMIRRVTRGGSGYSIELDF